MAGMGKTQLALEYVYQQLDHYWKVLWVDAGVENLLLNYLGLAEELGVTLEDENLRAIATREAGVAHIRKALECLPMACLLVFDDIRDETQLHRLLPKTGKCRVIVTTRRRLIRNFQNIFLRQLSKKDGLTLLRNSPHPGDFEKDLEILAERFDHLTLALSVCSAWLQESNLKPVELLRRLDMKGELVRSFSGQEVDPVFSKNPDLMTLFQESIEQVSQTRTGRFGERVLWVGGWFAGVPIRSKLFFKAASSLEEGLVEGVEVEEAIDLLVRFNLADRGAIGDLDQQEAVQGVVFHTVIQSFGRVKGGPEGARAMVNALMQEGNTRFDKEHL